MCEHIFVAIVLLVIIRKILTLHFESRGKTSLKSNLTKMFLRLSRKFSFVNEKIEKELETEAAKGLDDILKEKKITCKYSELPKVGRDR